MRIVLNDAPLGNAVLYYLHTAFVVFFCKRYDSFCERSCTVVICYRAQSPSTVTAK